MRFLAAILAVFLALPAMAQQKTSGPQAGAAVSKWDGASHAAYFEDPMEWARFQTIMSAIEFRNLRIGTERSDGARLEGGYLVMTGCAVRICDDEQGGIAVHVKTGKPMAVFWRKGWPAEIYGATETALPKALKLIAARRK